MKHCTKCNLVKPKRCFYAAKTNRDGLMGICKECHKARCGNSFNSEKAFGLELRHVTHKKCSRCEKIKRLEYFRLYPNGRHMGYCAECMKNNPLTDPNQRRCKTCETFKTVDQFSGKRCVCKDCFAKTQREKRRKAAEKTCRHCGQVKSRSEFHKSLVGPDLMLDCKVCTEAKRKLKRKVRSFL